MKKHFFLFVFIACCSCSKKIAKTTDFLLFDANKPKYYNDSIVRNFLDQHHIYAVGLKWVDVNFEGRSYQLPRSCDQEDLNNFFNANPLRNDEEFSFEQMSKENYSEVKNRRKEVSVDVEKDTSRKNAPRVIQYSFINFIDEHRVIFISNNYVKYKNYNPVISPGVFQTNLDENKKKNSFERGYYEWSSDNILIVELRQTTKEPSKKLYFKLLDEDLILYKIETFKLKKIANSDSTIQILDLSIDLVRNLPDVVQLPIYFRIQKEYELRLISQKIGPIYYERELISHQNTDIYLYLRKYYLQDTLIKESLNKKDCITW